MSHNEHPEYRIGHLEARVAELTAQLEQAHKINYFLLQLYTDSKNVLGVPNPQTPSREPEHVASSTNSVSFHLKSKSSPSASASHESNVGYIAISSFFVKEYLT